MELNSRDGKLRVLFGDRLVTLLNEVRQLSSLGYDIPSKITKCVDTAKKFYQYGVELQAVGLPKANGRGGHLSRSDRSFLQHDRHGNDIQSAIDDARPSEELRTSHQRSKSVS